MYEFDRVNVNYHVRDKQRIALIISSYQPNKQSSDTLRVALDSMLKFKRNDACIWVIDVGSPPSDYLVTPEEYKKINFVITDYTPRSWDSTPTLRKIINKIWRIKPPRAGSFANGWTLDFGIYSFEKLGYKPEYFMTLQMDVMFTSETILDDLLSLFDEHTAATGVLKQPNYDNTCMILHSVGCLWKTEIFYQLNYGFMNSFPKYDVGEKAIALSLKKGFKINSFKNTYIDESLVDELEEKFKRLNHVDRCINNSGKVIYMHLGRGIVKSEKKYYKSGRTTLKEWISWYNKEILCQ